MRMSTEDEQVDPMVKTRSAFAQGGLRRRHKGLRHIGISPRKSPQIAMMGQLQFADA